MRLTIFHNQEPEALWNHSLKKLITPLSFKDLKAMGDVHIAVFNDGVVGLAVTHDNEIVFLKVRDITRRRGVGKYLIEETCHFVEEEGFQKTIINTARFPQEEIDGIIYFLEMQGFQKDEADNNIYEFSEE